MKSSNIPIEGNYETPLSAKLCHTFDSLDLSTLAKYNLLLQSLKERKI